MRAVDATYPIDLLKGLPGAVAKSKALAGTGEFVVIPAPALAEILVGAHYAGGALLKETLELMQEFEVLPIGGEVAHDAGRLGAELLRRGVRMSGIDLLIAAACVRHQLNLVTRDTAYGQVPGLAVESY
jgi:predicted nucleic acid-binding protein